MPRIMTAAMQAALTAPNVRLALLSDLTFATDTVHIWTGLGNITWNGNSYQGVGTFADISEMSEDSAVEAKNVTVSLAAIPSSMLNEVLNEVRVLGTCNVWLVLYDDAGKLIDTPILSYQGKMDAPQLKDDGKTFTCALSLENVLVDLNRPVYRRYTDADQQMDLADTLTKLSMPTNTVDTGFTHVAGLQLQVVFWGRSPSSVNNV